MPRFIFCIPVCLCLLTHAQSWNFAVAEALGQNLLGSKAFSNPQSVSTLPFSQESWSLSGSNLYGIREYSTMSTSVHLKLAPMHLGLLYQIQSPSKLRAHTICMGSGVALAEKMAVGVYFGASLLNSKEQKAIWNPMAGVSVCYLGPDSTAISACLSINRQRSMVLLEYHLSARIRLRDELRWYSQVVIQNLYRLDWRTGLELLLPGKSIMLGYRNKSSTLSAGLGINRGIQIYLCLSYHSSLGISPVLSFLDAL